MLLLNLDSPFGRLTATVKNFYHRASDRSNVSANRLSGCFVQSVPAQSGKVVVPDSKPAEREK